MLGKKGVKAVQSPRQACLQTPSDVAKQWKKNRAKNKEQASCSQSVVSETKQENSPTIRVDHLHSHACGSITAKEDSCGVSCILLFPKDFPEVTMSLLHHSILDMGVRAERITCAFSLHVAEPRCFNSHIWTWWRDCTSLRNHGIWAGQDFELGLVGKKLNLCCVCVTKGAHGYLVTRGAEVTKGIFLMTKSLWVVLAREKLSSQNYISQPELHFPAPSESSGPMWLTTSGQWNVSRNDMCPFQSRLVKIYSVPYFSIFFFL